MLAVQCYYIFASYGEKVPDCALGSDICPSNMAMYCPYFGFSILDQGVNSLIGPTVTVCVIVIELESML